MPERMSLYHGANPAQLDNLRARAIQAQYCMSGMGRHPNTPGGPA
jgi:hypothetical protein